VTPLAVGAAAVRWLTFGCMAASIGAATFRFLVHPRTAPADPLTGGRRLSIAASAGAWTAALLAPLAVLRYLLLPGNSLPARPARPPKISSDWYAAQSHRPPPIGRRKRGGA
jgi:hypothetical protein